MKNFNKYIIQIICLIILLVPSLMIASPFSTDSDLKVFPHNQNLNFETQANKETSQSFSIQNTSDNHKRITITSNLNGPFYYYGSNEISIPAQSSSYVTIHFKPTQSGSFTSDLKIRHNDTSETKTIKLNAIAYSSNSDNGITLDTQKINFSNKDINSTSTYSIRINNNNSSPVNISTNSLKSPFQVTQSPSKIDANSSSNVTVSYNPTQEGSYDTNLVINTSDRNKQTINIPITGSTSNNKISPNQKEGKLNISRTDIKFETQINSSQTQNIILSNPNSFPITVKLPSDIQKPFTAKIQNGVSGKATILPGNTKTLSIQFAPTKKQSYSTNINLQTNLSNNPNYTIKANANTQYQQDKDPVKQPTQRPKYQIREPYHHPITSLVLTKANINPDIEELTYFNLNLGREFNTSNNKAILKIINPKTRETIYTQSQNNLTLGTNHWKLFWNGKNYQGNSMLAGNYEFDLDLYAGNSYIKDYHGSINVTRNTSHIPQKIQQKDNNSQNYYKHCSTYLDVQEDSNLCSAIFFAESQNLLKKGETKFQPKSKVTRSQSLSTIMKLMDIQLSTYSSPQDKKLGYTDTEINAWYMPFLKTAQYINKDGNILNPNQQKFEPNKAVNRAELYKLFFETANSNTQNKPQYLMDYFLTEKPFQDTLVESNYDWFTPYAGIAARNFNGTNFSKKYYGSFQINPETTQFCPDKKITKQEFFEFLYETHKLKLVSYK